MKVEVGKFYKNRIGEKVQAVCHASGGDTVLLSNAHFVFTTTGLGNYEWEEPNENDLIEEWKEPEVKEPKFKVGDRVAAIGGKWMSKTGNKIVKITDKDYYIAPSWDESISNPYPIEVWDDRLELVETKPEIIVGSRWTFDGSDNFVVEVIHINATSLPVLKVIAKGDEDEYSENDIFDFTGKGGSPFLELYKPYVEPPKSLVGYVGVFKVKETGEFGFSGIADSVEIIEKVEDSFKKECDLITIKKIEWTEGE